MKIIDFILCDDIRREVGNKRTIVGTYIDRIIFHSAHGSSPWPTNKQIGLYATLKIEEKDPNFDAFQITFSLDQEPLGKAEGRIISANLDISKTAVFDIVVPIVFKKAGTMTIKIQFLMDGKVVLDSLPELAIAIEEAQPTESKVAKNLN